MRIALLIVLLTQTLVGVIPAQAQSAATIETLQAEYWPEYDRPEMLVIFRLQVTAPAGPVKVRIQLPPTVTATNAVAVVNANGQLVNAPYELATTDGGFELQVETEARLIQVEFYDSLPRVGQQRDYAGLAIFSLDILNTIVRVQQPVGATNLQATPGDYQFAPEADGLNYAYANLGALPVGQPLSFSLSYDKASEKLSIESLGTNPALPVGSGEGDFAWLAWVLAAAGLGMIGYALFRTLQERKVGLRRKPKRARRGRAKTNTGPGGFCPECGLRAAPGDAYCRQCGTALRR